MDETENRRGAFFARHGSKLAYSLLSPSTIATTGVVAALAIAGGLPLVIAGAVTAGAYAVKVAAQTFTGKDLSEIIHPEPRVDLKRLRNPYRAWVERGIDARDRFRDAISRAPEGPLTQRLGGIAEDLGESIASLGRAAERAQQIDDYLVRQPPSSLQLQLSGAEDRLAAASDPEVRPDLERVVTSLREQVRVAGRLQDFRDRSVSRIETTIAQIDQLTAQLMEVLLTAEDVGDVAGAGNVDTLVAQLDSVRSAVAELDPRVASSDAEAEVQALLDADPGTVRTREGPVPS
ncbi:MAG: hypothetical protein K1X95_07380 [Acidimicrobiia bacterium]|nr:hypothetical protein [Acidimicrobiia bacterium]